VAPLALALRRAKTCRTVRATRDGRAVYVRTRPWPAWWLVPVANLLLRRMRAGVRFAANDEWRAWEPAVYGTLGHGPAAVDDRGRVIVPALEGRTLAALLSSPDVADDTRHRALRASVRELRRAHGSEVVAPPAGRPVRFTHGDATAANVICDVANDRARWIDFETFHDDAVPPDERRADDLRALLTSAAERWRASGEDRLAAAVREEYPDPPVLRALARMLRNPAPNLYHVAQGNVPASRRFRIADHLAPKA
jgi:hypothetical protein